MNPAGLAALLVVFAVALSCGQYASGQASPHVEYVDKFGTSGAGEGEFSFPKDLTVNSTHVIVADTINFRVQIFTLDGTFQAEFGGQGDADGQFQSPQAVAINSTHILVSDDAKSNIQVFDRSGTYKAKFGTSGTGTGEIRGPAGIAIDDSIYTSDSIRSVGHIFHADGRYDSVFGNSGEGQLSGPVGIAINTTHVIVADTGSHSIKIFNRDGTYADTFGFSGSGNGQFNIPSGVALTQDYILVTDRSNHRVQVFDKSGNYLSEFGSGSSGTENGTFNQPHGIAVTGEGRIFVADASNNRVQEFAFCAMGEVITNGECAAPLTCTVPQIPVDGACTDPITLYHVSQFNGVGTPTGALGEVNNIDANSTHIITVSGFPTRAIIHEHDGTHALTLADPTSTSDWSPAGVAIGHGHMAVTDFQTRTTHIFDDEGTHIHSFTPGGDPSSVATNSTHVFVAHEENGYLNIHNYAGAEQRRIENGIASPFGVGLAGDEILIVDSATHVRRFDHSGNYLGDIANPNDPFTRAVAVVANAYHVFVADETENKIQIFNRNYEYVGQFSDSGTGSGQFGTLSDVAATDDGSVFVADSDNDRVQQLSFCQGDQTFANGVCTDPPCDVGQNVVDGTCIDTGCIGSQTYDVATMICNDPVCTGDQTVVDGECTGPQCIGDRIYDATNQVCNDPGCPGQQIVVRGICSDPLTLNLIERFGERGTGNGGLNDPQGVAANSTHVIVIDTFNNIIQVFDRNGTFAGQFGAHGAGVGEFNSAVAVTVTSDRIIVFDAGNDRIQIYNLGGEFVSEFDVRFGNRLSFAQGIAANSTHILLADADAHLVRVFDYAGVQQHQFGGERPSSHTDDDPGGLFNGPISIDINSTHILVADVGSVQIFDHSGNYIAYIPPPTGDAAYGRVGGAILTPDNIVVASQLPAEVYIFDPDATYRGKYVATGESYDAMASTGDGHIFAVEGTNHRVAHFSFCTGEQTLVGGACTDPVCEDGKVLDDTTKTCGAPVCTGEQVLVGGACTDQLTINYLSQFGSTGTGDDEFDSPFGIDANSTHIIVVDRENERVKMHERNGTFVRSLVDPNGFTLPLGTVMAPDSILVSDATDEQIKIFEADGTYRGVFESAGYPAGIDANSTHTFVANTTGSVVHVYDSAGTEAGTIGSGVLTDPSDVALAEDAVIVSDLDGSVHRFDYSGGTLGTIENLDDAFDGAVAVDLTAHHIVVLDTSENKVQIFNHDYEYLGQFGESGTGNGQFTGPSGIAATSDGRIFVSDTNNDRIQEFSFCEGDQTLNEDGICQAPVCGEGQAPVNNVCVESIRISHLGSFAGEGTNALSSPEGIDANSTHIIVADTTTGVAQVFHRNGTHALSISGDPSFSEPSGVALTSENILVADFTGGEVQIFDTDGTYSDIVTGLDGPNSVDANSTHWFIADQNEPALYIYDNTGTRNTTITDQIPAPYDVEVTADAIIVADNGGTVQVYDHSGTHIRAIANADDAFTNPSAVASTPHHILVADSTENKVQIFNHDYEYLGQFGTEGTGADQISTPSGMVATFDGRIFVSDTDNSRIQEFSFCEGDQTLDGDGVCQDPACADTQLVVRGTCTDPLAIDYVSQFGSAGSGNNQFDNPSGIDANSTHVIVTDSNNDRVKLHHRNGSFASFVGTSGSYEGPVGAALAPGHTLVTESDASSVRIFDADGSEREVAVGSPSGVAGNDTRFFVTDLATDTVHVYEYDGTANGTFGGGLLTDPFDVVLVSSTIIVSDTDSVRTFDYSGNHIGTIENPDDAFDTPIAVSATEDYILVADFEEDKVQIFDHDGSYRGQFGTTGTGEGQFSSPSGIVATSDGRIFVSDADNDRIQEFNFCEGHQTLVNGACEDPVCTGDTDFDPATKRCDDTCIGEQTFNTGTNLCVDPACIGGQTFDDTAKICEDPNCTGDTALNPDTKVCDHTCIGEQTFNTGTNLCENPTCIGDQRLNDATKICEDPVCTGSQIVVDGTCTDPLTINYISQFGSTGTSVDEFNSPYGIDANSTHVIVTDSSNNRVKVHHRNGIFASFVNTTGSYNLPLGVDLAPDHILVANGDAGRVLIFGADGSESEVAVGSPSGVAGNDTRFFVTDLVTDTVHVYEYDGTANGTFGGGLLADPSDVELASSTIIVSDPSSVRIFDYSGNHTGTIANPDDEFNSPIAASATADYILVTDVLEHKVQIFDHGGNYRGQFGEEGSGDGQLINPRGIVATADGRIFVVDSGNDRIQEFSFCEAHHTLDDNGACITTGCIGDQTFDLSTNACVDPVCVDRQILEDGICHNILEITRLGILGDPIQLGSPSGIATNATHVLVTDTADDTINVFRHDGTFVSEFGGAGELSSPNDVALNSTHIIVADTGNARVSIFHHNGTQQLQSGGTGTVLETPVSVAVTGDSIYVMDISQPGLLIYNHSMQFVKSDGTYGDGGSLGTNSTHVLATNSESNEVFTYDGDDDLVSSATFGTTGPSPLAFPLGVGLTDDYILVGNGNTGVINIYNHSRGYLEGFDTTLGIHAASGVSDLAVTAEGRVYVVDDINKLVHMYRLCADDQTLENGRCIDISCTDAQTAIEGVCVDAGCTATQTYDRTTKKCTEPLDINYITQFGSTGSGNDKFGDPLGIAANSTHVLVGDLGNALMKIFHHNGTFATSFGGGGTADGNFQGIIAIDVIPDNIVVADQIRSNIQIFNYSGVYEDGFSHTAPRGMAANSTHIMAVNGVDDTVRIYAHNGTEQHSFDPLLESPHGLAANSTHILVTGNTDHIVGVYSHSGDLEGFIGGPGDGDGQFSAPDGVTITEEFILVADEGLGRVQVFDHDGTYRAKFTGNDMDVFDQPQALAVSPQGRIFVADDDTDTPDAKDRVMVFSFCEGDQTRENGICIDPTCIGDQNLDAGVCHNPTCVGEQTVVAGVCTNPTCEEKQTIVYGTCTDALQIKFARQFGRPGTGEGQLGFPSYITTNSTHIIVTEVGNNRVSIFHHNGTYAAQFGEAGTGDGQFASPYGVATNSTHIIVADSLNHRIQTFYHNGTYAGQFGGPGTGTGNGEFDNPLGLAITSTHIIVVDSLNYRIQTFHHNGTYAAQFGGEGTGNGQFKTASGPSDVAVDSAGQIFVSDTGNDRIQVFDSGGTYVSQFGSEGAGVGQFNGPTGVFIEEKSQRIFVSDSGNGRVQVFDLAGRYLAQFGETGAGEGQFTIPFGVYANSTHILSTDTGNSRVQVLAYSTMHTCPDGEVFVGRVCEEVCGVGERFTAGECVDIICPGDQTLEGNTCVDITCPAGQTLRNGVCVPVPICTGQQTLVDNTCVDPVCRGAQVVQNGTCVDPTSRDRDTGRSGGGGGGGSSSGRHSGAEVCGDRLCSEIEARVPGITPTPPAEYVRDPDIEFSDGYVAWSQRLFDWHDEGLIDDDTFYGALAYLDARGLLPDI